MHRKQVVLGALLVVALLLTGLSFHLIRSGLEHVLPASQLRLGQRDWQDGHTDRAVQELASALAMALECGVRCMTADSYITRMRTMESSADIRGALEQCAIAVKILEGCDDEGTLSDHCAYLEQKITR